MDVLVGLKSSFSKPVRKISACWHWWKVWHTLPIISWLHAADAFRRSDFRSAGKFYRKGLRRHGEHPASQCARLDYSYCLYRLGELQLANDELSLLIEKGTTLREAFLLQARILLNMGRTTEASYVLERAVEQFPDDVRLFVTYSQLVFADSEDGVLISKCAEGLERLRLKTTTTAEEMPFVEVALSLFEINHGETSEGEQILSRVLSSGMAPFEAYLLRGSSFLQQGRVLQARGMLNRAMVMSPRDPRPAILLASSYLREGDFFEPQWAHQLATAACRNSEWQHGEALKILIESYTAIGDTVAAELLTGRLHATSTQREMLLTHTRDILERSNRARSAKVENI